MTTRQSESPFAGIRQLSRELAGMTEEDVTRARKRARRMRRIIGVKQYCSVACVLALTVAFTTACAWSVAILVDLWP